jgi:hypothetical protein
MVNTKISALPKFTGDSRVYRVILMIGGSYLNNFISIERLY